jgi:hypothetical protein
MTCACMLCRARYHSGLGPLPGHTGYAAWPVVTTRPAGGGEVFPVPQNITSGHRDGAPAPVAPRAPAAWPAEPIGTLPRSHVGAPPGRWMNTYPAPHECVSPAMPPGSLVVCGQCRTQRRRNPDGTVAIYPYGQRAAHTDPPAAIRLPTHPAELDEAEADRLRAAFEAACQRGGPLMILGAVPEAAARPVPGSAEWWGQATPDDLEPGAKACTGCRLTVPPPDPETGLCRFCQDARPAAVKATPPAPRVSTRTRPRARRPVPSAAVPLAMVLGVILSAPASPPWFLFIGLFIAVLSYRNLRR